MMSMLKLGNARMGYACIVIVLLSCLATSIIFQARSDGGTNGSVLRGIEPSATMIDIDGNEAADMYFSSNGTSGMTFDDAFSLNNRTFIDVDSSVRVSNTDRFIRFRSCRFLNGNTGILLDNASNVFLEGCTFYSLSNTAVEITGSSDCVIIDSHFQSNNKALLFTQDQRVIVENNTFFRNQIAAYMNHAYNINFSKNIVLENNVGVTIILNSLDNMFWNNYFVNNSIAASDPDIGNSWDNGTTGNYWSDYSGRYPGAVIDNGTWSLDYQLLDYFPDIYDYYPVPYCDFPLPYFTINPLNVTTGETIHLSYAGIQQPGNLFIAWDFGDGTSINGTNHTSPIHAYAVAGCYSITVRTTDVDGESRSFSYINTVNVVAMTIPGFYIPFIIGFLMVALYILFQRFLKKMK